MVAFGVIPSHSFRRSALEDRPLGEMNVVRAVHAAALECAVEAGLAVLRLREPRCTILLLYALGENTAAISRALGWTPAQVDDALEKGLAQLSDAGGGGEPWELR
jgi:hypothetical protein